MLKEFIALFLSLSLCGCVNTATPKESNLTARYIDVGQGDCALVTLPNGENLLIDGGDVQFSSRVIAAVNKADIKTLDYVVATHPHADHIGGLDDAIRTFEVKRVFMPRITSTTKAFESLLSAIDEKGLQIETAKEGVVIYEDTDCSVKFIAPTKDEYDDLNDYSAVIRIVYKDTSLLFTGDAETESQGLWNGDIGADVLKVAHHGSKDGTKKKFLQRVHPTYAVISCDGKSYGHPTKEALEALSEANVTVYRTDLNGTITAISDGKNIKITTEK